MLVPKTPKDEFKRLQYLKSLSLLDTAPEERFDRLTRILQRLLNVPIALISLIDQDRQWFKSRQGLEIGETKRSVSFCGHTILGDGCFVVPNTDQDPRFRDNPLVTGEPHIRAYAGSPLRFEGHHIGTLCVIEQQPREFSADELQTLRDLADCVEAELERQSLWRDRAMLASSELQLRSAIAEKKRADEARERLQRELMRFFELPLNFLCVTNLEGRFERVSAAFTQLLGYSRESLRSCSLLDLTHPSDLQEVRRVLWRLDRTGQTFVQRCRDAEGKYLSLLWNVIAEPASNKFYMAAVDITAQRQAQQELRDAAEHTQAIIDNMTDGLITLDLEQWTWTFNPAAERIFGYNVDEMHDVEQKMLCQLWRQRLIETAVSWGDQGEPMTSTPIKWEIDGLRRDGSRVPLELSMSMLSSHEAPRLVGVVRDLSDQRNMERLQSEFISALSHELRTPLSSIRGALDLIASDLWGDMPPEISELIQIARRNSKRLQRHVDDFLDLEKLGAGQMSLNLQTMTLNELIQQEIACGRTYNATRQIFIEFEATEPSIQVRADPHRIRQVLSNLLSNAIKFSPDQGRVEVQLTRRDRWARVSISDSGAGVPEAFQARIFQRFAQANGAGHHRQLGTGLGLAICQGLIERMGGTIDFHSIEGKGSTFYFELPIVR